MAQVRQILTRIDSVKNTQKITKAMKMVAAAKLSRAQARMESIRKYAGNIAHSILGIKSNLFGDEHPLLRTHKTVKRELYIVIAGDRGLCGGFNSNIMRYVASHIQPNANNNVEKKFYAVGKRAIGNLKKRYGAESVIHTWTDVFDKLAFTLTNDIAKNLLHHYQISTAAQQVDAVYLVYNRFASRLRQEIVTEQIMPLNMDDVKKDAQMSGCDEHSKRLVYSIEPDAETAMSELVEHYLSTNIFHAITESYAAELAARVNAMENATSSAKEMIENLTLLYNRARQAGITNELLDIIGGANALGG